MLMKRGGEDAHHSWSWYSYTTVLVHGSQISIVPVTTYFLWVGKPGQYIFSLHIKDLL